MKIKHKLTRGIISMLMLFFLIGIINPLKMVYYEVVTDKSSGELTVVHLSDLHSHLYGSDQQQLIKKIKSSDPDVIFLTGDIADDVTPLTGTVLLLEGIKDIAPVYYVTGNHEYWADNTEEILKVIKGYGIIVLSERTEFINIKTHMITVSGLNDPDIYRYEKIEYNDGFLLDLEEDTFNILLAHRPERIEEYLKYEVDLVLSGHAHGGQIRIPFILNGLYSPNQGWFPPYAGGKYCLNDSVMIVSRGLSFNRFIPRFYNRPEIVVVRIQGVNK